MLTIRVTTGICLGGAGNDVAEGTMLVAPRDIPNEKALHLVQIKAAVMIRNDENGGSVLAEPPKVVTRDPELESLDPELGAPEGAPRRRARSGRRVSE